MSEQQKRILMSRAGRLVPRITKAPLLSSAHNNWEGVQLERHKLTGPAESTGVIEGYQICVNLSGPVHVEWLVDGRWVGNTLNSGDLCLATHGEFRKVAWHESYDLLLLSLSPQLMLEMNMDADRARPLELKPQRAFRDRNIESISKLLLADTAAGTPAGPGYGEHLASSLTAYLSSQFGATNAHLNSPGSCLPAPALRRVCELIEDRLNTPIGLQDLAREANMSRFYFSRLFRNSTGHAPYHYLLMRRIERAKEMLAAGSGDIEVAEACGFSSPSHLSAMFRRSTGITPRKFRSLSKK